MKKILALLLALSVLMGVSSAMAADYPSGKLINLVCPWGAGGSTDITARALANVAEKMFGTSVIVTNREGGGSTIGTQEVAMSTATDGGTILVATVNALAILPHTMGLGYTPENFKAIGQVSVRDMGIICKADKPWNTIVDFLEDAKANPGKYLVSCPQGGLQNILFQMLADQTGAEFTVYPVNNDTENLTAVLGGISDIGVPGSYDVAAGQIAAGEVKLLGLFSDRRLENLPDVPTLQELGFDLTFYPWTALLVPTTTDDEIVAAMQEAWAKVLQSEELAELLKKNGQTPMYMDGAAMDENMLTQYNDFGETIQSMGLSAQ